MKCTMGGVGRGTRNNRLGFEDIWICIRIRKFFSLFNFPINFAKRWHRALPHIVHHYLDQGRSRTFEAVFGQYWPIGAS